MRMFFSENTENQQTACTNEKKQDLRVSSPLTTSMKIDKHSFSLQKALIVACCD